MHLTEDINISTKFKKKKTLPIYINNLARSRAVAYMKSSTFSCTLFQKIHLLLTTSDGQFVTAIFLLWEGKNRMTGEFRCMFTKF